MVGAEDLYIYLYLSLSISIYLLQYAKVLDWLKPLLLATRQ